MTPDKIADTALQAVAAFLKDERDLLKANANERSLTHKVAEHLQRAFPDWHVDCEYNRLGNGVKYLPAPEDSRTDDTEGRTIFPDIIVHKRRKNENLLVIEVKKTTNNLPGDEHKLCGLTLPEGDFAYTLGIHLIIDCAGCGVADATAYTQGDRNEKMTALLLRYLDGMGGRLRQTA